MEQKQLAIILSVAVFAAIISSVLTTTITGNAVHVRQVNPFGKTDVYTTSEIDTLLVDLENKIKDRYDDQAASCDEDDTCEVKGTVEGTSGSIEVRTPSGKGTFYATDTGVGLATVSADGIVGLYGAAAVKAKTESFEVNEPKDNAHLLLRNELGGYAALIANNYFNLYTDYFNVVANQVRLSSLATNTNLNGTVCVDSQGNLFMSLSSCN